MLLKNGGSIIWQLNFLTSYILFILVTDWLSVTLLSIIGILLGFFFYYITTINPVLPSNIVGIGANFIALLLFCGFFLHKKSQRYIEKIQTVQLMAASIAHEMATPLRGIDSGVKAVKGMLTRVFAKCKSDQNAEANKAMLILDHVAAEADMAGACHI